MKITAGPATVINARAAKLAIRWISKPMALKHVLTFDTGYGFPTLRSQNHGLHCDGLSQQSA